MFLSWEITLQSHIYSLATPEKKDQCKTSCTPTQRIRKEAVASVTEIKTTSSGFIHSAIRMTHQNKTNSSTQNETCPDELLKYCWLCTDFLI